MIWPALAADRCLLRRRGGALGLELRLAGSRRRRRRSRSRRRAAPGGRRPAADVSACFAWSAASLASSWSLSACLLLLLLLEVRLLALELVVHRGELLHDVVVGLVGLVERAACAGSRSPRRSSRRGLELVARVRVREDRPLRGRWPGAPSACALVAAIESLSLAMVACVVVELVVGGGERGRGLVALPAGVGELLARGGEVVLGRRAGRRGAGPQSTARATRTRRTRRSRVIEQGLGARGSGNASSR